MGGRVERAGTFLRQQWPAALAGGAGGALLVVVLSSSFGPTSRWIEGHPGTAAWLQAAGSLAAVWSVLMIAQSQRRSAETAERKAHDQIVDLCAELGQRAWDKTHETLQILFQVPEQSPGAPPQLAPLGQWRLVMDDTREALNAVPRDRIRDPLLSYAVAQLSRALEIEAAHRMASQHLTTAQDVLNMREIEIGATVEAIRARRTAAL